MEEVGFLYPPKAYPIADGDLEVRVLNIVHEALNYEQLKRGINESKTLMGVSVNASKHPYSHSHTYIAAHTLIHISMHTLSHAHIRQACVQAWPSA